MSDESWNKSPNNDTAMARKYAQSPFGIRSVEYGAYLDGRQSLRAELEKATERVQFFTHQLRLLRDEIIENAHDVVWVNDAETVCERITHILGDDWSKDGDTSSLRSRQDYASVSASKTDIPPGTYQSAQDGCPHCAIEAANPNSLVNRLTPKVTTQERKSCDYCGDRDIVGGVCQNCGKESSNGVSDEKA